LNTPKPALVSQRAAQGMPRWILLLFCTAYVLPGLFGRDPWRSADVTAFGYMWGIAQGKASWLAPSIGGVVADGALWPYALGAGFIKALSPWLLDPALAARVPFALLLTAVLVLSWYSTYHLARTDAAQPLPFAFGGEADPVDYARAMADGAVLAVMATLGLLQLGHETTPELGQLAALSLYVYALSASPYRGWKSRVAALLATPLLAVSGAPSVALGLSIAGALLCYYSSYAEAKRLSPWLAVSGGLGVLLAWGVGAWAWRVGAHSSLGYLLNLPRQLLWFAWPTWPLALWTLWRWRSQWRNRHIGVPLSAAAITLITWVVMGGEERALMLALPPLAILASFSLPTLQRSTAAAIDWFSVFFFTACTLTIWVVYVAMQTGLPAQPAANVARLAPGFTPIFSSLALVFAIVATGAWAWLVAWRTGRNRHPVWKSMVLPASGVALCWLLLMTLWLPLLNHARSYRPLVQRMAAHIPADRNCVVASNVPAGQIAAMEYFGGYEVDASVAARTGASSCRFWIQVAHRSRKLEEPLGWKQMAQVTRPTDPQEVTWIFKRVDLQSIKNIKKQKNTSAD
jgi:hypothetical protein